jgi:hypothetical protein
MRTILLSALCIPGLVGCLDNIEDLSVADLAQRGAALHFAAFQTAYRPALYVQMQVDDGDPRTCERLAANVSGSVSGAQLDVFRGIDEDNNCTEPNLALFDPPELDVADFVLSDGRTSVTCHLGTALAPQRLTMVSPNGWTLHTGQRVTVQWPGISDGLINGDEPEVYLAAVGEAATFAVRVDASFGDDRETATFVVPSTLDPGPRRLQINGLDGFVHSEYDEMIDCGPFSARLRRVVEAGQEITIAP